MGQIKINELPQQSNTDNVKVVGVTESGNGVLVPIENSIATKEELAEIGSKVGDVEKKTSNINKGPTESDEDAIIFETNSGVKVGQINADGADFKDLKSNGKEVLTEHQDISQLATKEEVNKKQDTLIAGKNITISADGKTISADGGVGDLPIHKETSTSEDDSIIIETNGGTTVAKITPEKVMVKEITDLEGNPIGGMTVSGGEGRDSMVFASKVIANKGSIVNNYPVYDESKTTRISQYIEVTPNTFIKFGSVNSVRGYSADKTYLSEGVTTIVSGSVYKVNAQTKYIIVSFSQAYNILMSAEKTEEGAKAIYYNMYQWVLHQDEPQRDINILEHRGLYRIGDSEATRFNSSFDSGVANISTTSSFGGHQNDVLASNVGIAAPSGTSVAYLDGCNAFVITGTNGGEAKRMVAYINELVTNLRKKGIRDIYCAGPFCALNTTKETYQKGIIYQGQKSFFGGHYIDFCSYVFDCGVYYNPYHAKQFIQPAVGDSVTMEFDNVSAFLDRYMGGSKIFTVGNDFYMQYKDSVYDIYTCQSIDETNNSIVAVLKETHSGITAGQKASLITETRSGSSYSTPATLTLAGFIYSPEDKQDVENGGLPRNIYSDNIHIATIGKRIMENLLFAIGGLSLPKNVGLSGIPMNIDNN